jgi:type I restriction enzyme M protein
MEHDGFSLDDRRQRVADNDIPDVLECWQRRHDAGFLKKRAVRLAKLRDQIAPLKKERLQHHALIHRLKFEEAVASNDGDKARKAREKAEAELAELQTRIEPLQKEINQLTRQFWVTKEQVAAQGYDLSASRYRQVEQDEEYREKPAVTLGRMQALEQAAGKQIKALEKMLKA